MSLVEEFEKFECYVALINNAKCCFCKILDKKMTFTLGQSENLVAREPSENDSSYASVWSLSL